MDRFGFPARILCNYSNISVRSHVRSTFSWSAAPQEPHRRARPSDEHRRCALLNSGSRRLQVNIVASRTKPPGPAFFASLAECLLREEPLKASIERAALTTKIPKDKHPLPMTTIGNASKRPLISGWQRCSHCFTDGWISQTFDVRNDRVIDVLRCENCRHEWRTEADTD